MAPSETSGSDATNTSRFLSEVREQPAALARLVRHYRGSGRGALDAWADLVRVKRRVRFAGMGTSEFAPWCVLPTLAGLGVDVDVMDAGELLHYPRPFEGQLTLVSQSGESAETRALAERWGRPAELAAVTNVTTSTLAHSAAIVLPLVAGDETAIAAKTYLNTLAVLRLMAAAVASDEAVGRTLERLDGAAAVLCAPDPFELEQATALLAPSRFLHCVGRGPALTAARQSALTLMEGARLGASALTGGAFRHGPLELAGPEHGALFFVAAGPTAELLAALAREVAHAGSRTLVVTDLPGGVEGLETVLHVPQLGEDLFPLACATAHAHLVEALARRLGREAGVFVRCRKVTDME